METKNLAKKLALIQQDIQPVVKDLNNPYFKSKYFGIDSVLAMLRPILVKHGVSVLQPLHDHNGRTSLATLIVDGESGESLSWSFLLPEISDLQKLGAAISYCRRFALTSLFAIEGEVDDDGESVVRDTEKAFSKPKMIRTPNPLMDEPPFPDVPPPPVEYVEGVTQDPPKETKQCKNCGTDFVAKFKWSTLCVPCYIKSKEEKK